jgi:hypothetical protein
MKFNNKQQNIINDIINYCKSNHNKDKEKYFTKYICIFDDNLLFDDNIILEIKNNFKVGNVGSYGYDTKPNNIQYIISVLKKANYKIKYDEMDNVYILTN